MRIIHEPKKGSVMK